MAGELLCYFPEALLFVVPRSTPQPIDPAKTAVSTRTAASQRSRTASNGTFTLHTDGAGRGSDTVPGRAGSQNIAATPATVTNPSPAATVTTATAPAVSTTSAPEASGTGMQRLLDTMSALGMSTSGLSISYSEEAVGYPGGSYMNRQIKVTAGGKTEQFSAELTDRNPMVTAYELQRYFGVAANVNGATGSIRQS